MRGRKKIIEINNLSEYIKRISYYKLKNYISRGENCKFSNITSSAFRSSKPFAFFRQIDEFYNIVGNEITEMQKDNFVAFSQHHGIPTNLIDFSSSPLVSLFFSCYGVNNETDSGYVYFIDNTRLINVGENLIDKNIFQMLTDSDRDIYPIIIELYKYTYTHPKDLKRMISILLNELKKDEDARDKYKELFKEINRIECSFDEDVLEYLIKIIKNINKGKGFVNRIRKDELDDFQLLVNNIPGRASYIYIYDVLWLLLLLKIVSKEVYFFLREPKSISLPFYLSYYPPNILSRISNQSSIFIYQLYYNDNTSDSFIEDTEERGVIQDVIPDYTFKINNQNEILKELDTMGINLKFIYNDYDNIAKYIRNKMK